MSSTRSVLYLVLLLTLAPALAGCVGTPSASAHHAGKTCEGGRVLVGFDGNGDPICRSITRSEISAILAAATCPPGQVLNGFEPDATPICVAPSAGAGGAQGPVGPAGPPGPPGAPAVLTDGAVSTQHIADGAVTAAKLSSACAAGQILKRGTAGWACVADVDNDTKYAAGAGLLLAGTTLSLDATDAGACSGAEAKLVWNAAANRLGCGSDADTTYAAGSGLSLVGTTLALDSAGIAACAAATAKVLWNATAGRLECGTDADTTYSSGKGLALAAGVLALDDGGLANCAGATSKVLWDAAAGRLVCGTDADNDTKYTSGTGLTLSGTAFALDSTGIAGCAGATAKIVWDSAASRLACAADVDTDMDTTYTNGTGLSLAGTTFALDTGGIGSCGGPDEKIVWNATAGKLACAADVDTDTTYSSGTGLALTGTVFALDTAGIAGCTAADEKVVWDAANGRLACATDADTTYAAGGGLTLASGAFALDLTDLAGCSDVSEKVVWDAANGRLACATDVDTDTTYTSGRGLSLTGTTFALDSTSIAGCTDANEKIVWDAANHRLACATDVDTDTDTDTTYTSGAGLILTGTVFALDATGIAGCTDADDKVAWDSANGRLTCAADLDTDTDTTYQHGDGLSLSGTTFALATDDIAACTGADEKIVWSTANGRLACGTDADTTYTAASGLVLATGVFGLDLTDLAGCTSADEKVVWDATAGRLACATDIDTDTDTTYAAGSGLTLDGTTFSLTTTGISACTDTAASKIVWNATHGRLACATDASMEYSAADGVVLTGSTFSLDSTQIEACTGVDDKIIWEAYARQLVCASDSDTTYSAGGGLALVTGVFSVSAGGITTAMLADGSVTPAKFSGVLGPTKGGTGQATWNDGDLLYASAADTLARLAVGSSGTVLKSSGGLPTWDALDTGDVSGTWAVSRGGTGLTSLTARGVLYAADADTMAVTASPSVNQVLRANPTTGVPEFGAVDLSKSAAVTGVLPGKNGGTGTSRVQFSGPSSLRTFTLPDTSGGIATLNNPAVGFDGKGQNWTSKNVFNGRVTMNRGVSIGDYQYCSTTCTLGVDGSTFILASAGSQTYYMTLPSPGYDDGSPKPVAYAGKVYFIKKFDTGGEIRLRCPLDNTNQPICNVENAAYYSITGGPRAVILVSDGFLDWWVLSTS